MCVFSAFDCFAIDCFVPCQAEGNKRLFLKSYLHSLPGRWSASMLEETFEGCSTGRTPKKKSVPHAKVKLWGCALAYCPFCTGLVLNWIGNIIQPALKAPLSLTPFSGVIGQSRQHWSCGQQRHVYNSPAECIVTKKQSLSWWEIMLQIQHWRIRLL